MRTEYLAAIAIAAVATGAGWTAYSVQTADYCPQPSAASVTALFAPCQAFAAALGPSFSEQEALRIGLLPLDKGPAAKPDREPAPTPAQLVAEDHQIPANEHATVGVAGPKRAR
jgi:hypothetical protein